jgi:hypothetical protein
MAASEANIWPFLPPEQTKSEIEFALYLRNGAVAPARAAVTAYCILSPRGRTSAALIAREVYGFGGGGGGGGAISYPSVGGAGL